MLGSSYGAVLYHQEGHPIWLIARPDVFRWFVECFTLRSFCPPFYRLFRRDFDAMQHGRTIPLADIRHRVIWAK
jgi:hypothetical protein